MSSKVHAISETKLTDYLEGQIEGFQGPLTLEKFADGQSNPTFLLSTSNGQYVLRSKPPGQLLKSAHAVDREYQVLTALTDSEVPVARPYHLCEDDNVIGSMFYVMSYEEGRIFWNAALPELQTEQRVLVSNEMIRVLAAIHNVDIEGVGLGDYGKPGNYFERQIGRWIKQYRACETESIKAMENLIRWLPDNLPADDGQVSLIHGDYRLDNLIFHPTEPRVLAVLDWELSTLGHPLADLAYYCMFLRLPAIGDIPGLAGIDRDALGLPTEEAIIERYCQWRNIGSIDNWHFYLAFSFFRLAAILQGVFKRALSGNASNEKAMLVGKMAGALAEIAAPLIR